MLLNDFYTCHDLQSGEQDITCRIEFDSAHAIFEGHFPGNPVVPGVCMMEIVKELLMEQVKVPLVLHTSGNVKFLNLITPGIKPNIKIDWKKTEDGYSAKASISIENTTYFKFDGTYRLAGS